MASFADIQAQQKAQQNTNTDDRAIKDATNDLRASTHNLSNTASNQMMMMQQLTQAIQQQSQQIQQLAMSNQTAAVATRAHMPQPMPQAPGGIRAAMAPAFGTAAAVGGIAGDMALGKMGQMGQAANLQYHRMRHTGHGINAATPGLLYSPNQGMAASMWHGTGMSWNPAAAQSYGFGAYSRSQAYNAGSSARDWGMGALGAGAGLLSGSSIGAGIGTVLGQAAIPIPLVGGMIGGAIGGMAGGAMDFANPISYGMQEAHRALAFGSQSNQHSNTFLRGMGQRGGAFGLREQAQIGSNMQRMMQRDLTFSDSDVRGLQESFAESGQMLGVQSATEYQQRFKKLLDNTKTIMKTLQMTQQEAVGFMSTAFSTIGADAGSQSAMLATRVGAAAHISGLSPQETMRRVAGASQQASRYGLMNMTGGITGAGGISLAGQAASSTVGTNLLATVGGEEGLAGIINNAQNKYLSGFGGVAGLRGKTGGVFQRLGRMGQMSMDDMINFAGAGAEQIDEMMQQDPLYAKRKMMMDLSQMADMMPGRNKRAKMALMARSMGLANSQTDALGLVDSMAALPEEINKQTMTKRRMARDAQYDMVAEQRGVGNKLRLAGRAAMRGLGVNDAVESITMGMSSFGEDVSAFSRDANDALLGITERTNVGSAMAEEIMSEEITGAVTSGGVDQDFSKQLGRVMNSGSSNARNIRDYIDSTRGSQILNRRKFNYAGAGTAAAGYAGASAATGGGLLLTPVAAVAGGIATSGHSFSGGDVKKLKQAAAAIKSGKRYRGVGGASGLENISTSGVTNEDAYQLARDYGMSEEELDALKTTLQESEEGLDIKDSGIKPLSEKELEKKYSEKFGINLKNYEDMGRLLENPLFRDIMQNIDKLVAIRQERAAAGKSDDAMPEEFYGLKRKISSQLEKLKSEDPEAYQLAMEALSKKGITMGEDGADFSKMFDELDTEYDSDRFHQARMKTTGTAVERRKSIFNTEKGGLDEFKKDRKAQVRQKAFQEGAASLGLTGDYTGGMNDDKVAADLRRLSETEIEDLISAGGQKGGIGKLAKRLKANPNEGISAEETRMVFGAVRDVGATQLSGGGGMSISGDIDGKMLGAMTANTFKEVASINKNTMFILQKIAEDI